MGDLLYKNERMNTFHVRKKIGRKYISCKDILKQFHHNHRYHEIKIMSRIIENEPLVNDKNSMELLCDRCNP